MKRLAVGAILTILAATVASGQDLSDIRPPELLDLAQGALLSVHAKLAMHPDPELPVVERQMPFAEKARCVSRGLQSFGQSDFFQRQMIQHRGGQQTRIRGRELRTIGKVIRDS